MFQQLLNAVFQSHGGGWATGTCTLHLQEDDALLETAIDNVTAILRHGGADAGFDELLNLADNIGIGGVVERIASSSDGTAIPLLGLNKGISAMK